MIKHTDLSKPIYDRLKEMILTEVLKPGEKIVQEKIAEVLGVSRTPLRKALLTLENEYLLESVPRRGMFVRTRDPKELIDVYHCREALEGMAARILAGKKNEEMIASLRACFAPFYQKKEINIAAYTKADEKFHKLIITLTENGPLDKIYLFGNIHDKVIGHGLIRPPEETLEEHIQIIEAIASGDANKAEACAREHIKKSTQLLIQNQIDN